MQPVKLSPLTVHSHSAPRRGTGRLYLDSASTSILRGELSAHAAAGTRTDLTLLDDFAISARKADKIATLFVSSLNYWKSTTHLRLVTGESTLWSVLGDGV